jgi:hypothetical protein
MTRRAFLPAPVRSLALAATIVFASSAAHAARIDNSTAASPAPTMTAGEFLIQYARAVHLELPTNVTPETALAALRASGALAGVDIPLDRALTHGDLVRIGRASGLKITSSTPDKAIERNEADLFLDAFARFLVPLPSASGDHVLASETDGSGPQSPEHANTDKGKKKGRPFTSPSEPVPPAGE